MSGGDEPFDPASLGEDAFLAGPDRYEEWDGEDDLLDIDDVFAKPFERILSEQHMAATRHGAASVEIVPDGAVTPSQRAPGYLFAEVEAGLILLTADGIPVGGYLGCDVAVDPAHQGKGLGAELILEYAMRNGGLPTWDLDTAAYSRAGAAAHRAAHALARDRAFFARKVEAFAEASRPLGAPAP